ncbi:MAG: MFS transporter [Acidimicrobiia bacterium]|nr:MFS transporter [Acidimicrobiia bacterium]
MAQHRRIVAAIMVATVSTVYPGFLIGALTVQVSDEFSVTEATYGWGLGGFFLAATAGSAVFGRLVQRVGPRRQILTGLVVTLAMNLYIALLAGGWWQLVGALAVAGFVNASNQTAVNLALTQAKIPRLGLAIALKQSGMPMASMISGLMVPAVALTVGWRWAYGLGAALAVVAIIGVLRYIDPLRPARRQARLGPVSGRRDLLMAAVLGGCLSFAAGSLNAWIVSSGVDAGLGEGTAGLMLSLGAASGIALRVFAGTRLDLMTLRPFLVAGLMVLAGAVGVALLTVRSPGIHMIATLLAFAGGWVWPVFTNYGIVRTNAATAGAATGVTQMGVYIGVFLAPLVTGWLIEQYGYGTMWSVVVVMILVGSTLALWVRNRF